MIKILGNRGDTIVEAMIAVMVIGLTIAGAYGVATRSLRAARQAQERGEALKVAEGQLETIKGISGGAVSSEANITDDTHVFCLKGSNRHDFTVGWGNTIKPIDEDELKNYPEECIPDTSNGLYHTVIQVQQLGDDRYQYTVAVRWPRLGSGQNDEVRIDYRIYKESD